MQHVSGVMSRSCALLCLLCWAACDGCEAPEAASTGCELDDGTTVAVGDTITPPDSCNICLCTTSLALRCTSAPCSDAGPADAGSPVDAGSGDAGVNVDAGVLDGGVDEGPCTDVDGDGFFSCTDPRFPERPTQVDCDDDRFHVQPGGYEFPDTVEDDNCDGAADDWLLCGCGTASTAAQQVAAMDLCGAPLVNATRSGQAPQFGVVSEYQGTIDPRLRAIVEAPGAPPLLLSNDCLATLSTGDAVGRGDSTLGGCTQSFGQNESMECDGCPPGSFFPPDGEAPICDLARLDLSLDVPANASGFAFDFMFLSYEWPEFLCQVYNDTFLANVRTEAVNGGAETNAAFDPQGRPITVNVGFFEEPSRWTVPLDGTSFGNAQPGVECPGADDESCTLPEYCAAPFDGRNGSGSGWLTTSVPVRPGEQDVQLTLRIHDESDADYDSIVLLDNFRWLPFEPPLQTGKEQ